MGFKGRIALTGRPGVGKTTLIERLLERLSVSAGGMLTKEIRVCGHRVGFAIVDVATRREEVLAHIHQRIGPKVGAYTVNLKSLEEFGIPAILHAIQENDLVVIDEVAPMEMSSPRFVPAVEAALGSSKGLLISTHAHADCPIAHRVRQELSLVRVRLGNRDELVESILTSLGAQQRA
ncbi:MAG: NTPase [Candidatus Bipolaricaulis sp.]|nr:NTPase [Candidatus Bipolaricaulis sp.]